MESGDVTDKEKEIKSSETVLNCSSRPKRKIRPKAYNDEFIIYVNHRNRVAATKVKPHERVVVHNNFTTSTPVLKSVKPVRQQLCKESVKSNSIQFDNIADSEIPSQIAQENDVLETESGSSKCYIKQNSSTMFMSAPETNENDCLAFNKCVTMCKSTENERPNTTNENINNSSANLIVLERKNSIQLDISVQKKQQPQTAKSKNKVLSTLEEPESPDNGRELSVSDTERHLKTHGRKRKKCEKKDDIHDSENSQEKDKDHTKTKLNNSEMFVKKVSKRRKFNSSCGVNNTERTEVSKFNNRIMLDKFHNVESEDQFENIQRVITQEPVSAFTESAEATVSSNVGSDVTPVLQKRPRGRPPKANKTLLTPKMQTGPPEISAVHASQERQMDDHLESVSQNSPKKELPETSSDLIAQDIQISLPDSKMTPVIKEKHILKPSEINAPLQRRPRGRPPKTVSQRFTREPSETSSDLVQQDINVGSLPDAKMTAVITELHVEKPPEINAPPQKRRRGRPPTIARPPAMTLFTATQASLYVSGGTSNLICLQCGKQMNSTTALQLHMMSDHSLTWSKEYPQGYDNPSAVLKRIGHIDCQKCQKRFRFAQYYRHHQIWCGREDELATCEICEHTMKAMWLQQHLTAHKTQEKKLALEAKRDLDKMEQDKDDDDDGQSNKKLKREAAKNAIKLMSSLQDTTEQEDASSSDGYAEESSESSNDDEEEDSEEEKDYEKRTSMKSGFTERETDKSCTTDSTINNIWMRACSSSVDLRPIKRLQLLYDFYAIQQKGRAFPDLSPRKNDWVSLADSEKKKYMPVSEESSKFTFGLTEDMAKRNGEHSLKFGHTMSHNGKTYCYTGGPVWALEWCPVPEGAGHEQILAISADRATGESSDTATVIEGPGLLQIWSVGSLKNKVSCCAEPVLQYAIAHDSGYVRSMSWCPHGCFDADVVDNGFFKRLGLLAVGGSDGRVIIYCAPQPEEMKQMKLSGKVNGTGNMFRPQPALVLVPNSRRGCGPCLSVSWQQGGDFKYIIAGYGQGAVFLWDISTTSPLLKVDSNTLRPTRSFIFHNAAIISCCWNPRNPSVFVTVSFDFSICVWDAERSEQPVGIIKRSHLKQVPRSVCWAGPLHNGFFSTCDKFLRCDLTPICFHGLSKAGLSDLNKSFIVQYNTSCTWDVSFCPFYELLVTCEATGKVKVMLLPMKSIRCRGASKKVSYRARMPLADLYQVKLRIGVLSPSLEPQNFSAVDSSDNLQTSAESIQKPPSNQSHSRNMSFTLENNCLNQCNEMNRTVPVEQPSDFNEHNSALLKKTPFSGNVNCFKKELDQNNIQDSVVSESCNTTPETITMKTVSVTSNNEVDNHTDSAIASSKDSTIGTEGSLQDVTFGSASDTSLESVLNDLITPSASCVGSANIAGAIDNTRSTEDSLISSRDPELATNCKRVITSAKGKHLEFSRACFDGLESPSTNQLVDTESSETVSEEVLHYHDCIMKKVLKRPKSAKPELEVYGGSNTHAVHRVRFNPSPACCLWLASGGQSGILRLDNLTSLVLPPYFRMSNGKIKQA